MVALQYIGAQFAKDACGGFILDALGDGFQLPPILDDDSAVSVYFDSQGRNLPVDFELNEIHRQAEGSPIIRYSRALRENRIDEINFIGKMEGSGTLIRVPRNRLADEHFIRAEQIIVGKNDTRHRVNEDRVGYSRLAYRLGKRHCYRTLLNYLY